MKKNLDYVIDNNLINLFFKELLDLKRFKDTCKKIFIKMLAHSTGNVLVIL